jgi:hypothetical protein
MAYATNNPPRLLVPGVAGSANVWIYIDGDAHADVDISGYFTNGYELGMRDGDQCIVVDTNLKVTSWHYVEILTGTTIDLADGTVIGSTTNSD